MANRCAQDRTTFTVFYEPATRTHSTLYPLLYGVPILDSPSGRFNSQAIKTPMTIRALASKPQSEDPAEVNFSQTPKQTIT